MSVSSAITINQTQQEIAARLPQADPPLSDDDAQVSFAPAPGDRGTEVRVVLPDAPEGLGEKVAAVMGVDAQRDLDDDLRRLKQVLETGEVVRSDGAPWGKRARKERSAAATRPAVGRRAVAARRKTMRANCWTGRNKVEVRDVPDPMILNTRDAIVRITSTAICGSDLHLVDGYVPTMQDGDVLGHEFMGEVVEVGPGVDPDGCASGTGSSCRSRSPAARAAPAPPSCTPAARTPTPTPGSRRRCSATRSPGSSATRI